MMCIIHVMLVQKYAHMETCIRQENKNNKKKTSQPTPPAEPPSSTASPNEAAALQLSSQSAASQIIQTRTRKCAASVLVCARATAMYDINSRTDFIYPI